MSAIGQDILTKLEAHHEADFDAEAERFRRVKVQIREGHYDIDGRKLGKAIDNLMEREFPKDPIALRIAQDNQAAIYAFAERPADFDDAA